jgi:hypothetical protein
MNGKQQAQALETLTSTGTPQVAARPGRAVKKLLISTSTALLAFAAFLLATTSAHAATCPNETIRQEQGFTYLPDCRGYEMVSPLEKNSGDIEGIDANSAGGVIQATPSGEKITYDSLASFADPEGAPVGSQYISTRAAGGWSIRNITTPLKAATYSFNGTPYKMFSSNLERGLLPNGEPPSGIVENAPVGGAPAGYRNFYLRDLESGSIEALVTAAPAESPVAFRPALQGGATPDLSHVVISNGNLYEWSAGQLQAINVPPNPTVPGETLPGAELGFGSGLVRGGRQSRTVSENGSRVFWTKGDLYVREGTDTPEPRTLQVDTAIGGGGEFLTASVNGAKVFFTKAMAAGAADLYEYDLETDTTTDIAPGAEVLGILGASEDGSYVYFVGNGKLSPDATQGDCTDGELSTSCNLYVAHEGQTRFIARLSGADEEGEQETKGISNDWQNGVWARTARVTSDGRQVVFMSKARVQTDAYPEGYDNQSAEPGECLSISSQSSCSEIYSYEVGAPKPICISCDPSGARPEGPSSIPGGTQFAKRQAIYDSRVISADGSRVFFNSSDALVAGDVNHRQDVYEWERSGTSVCPEEVGCHTCTKTSGCVALISGGTSSEDSSFADASEDGGDVFFITRGQLVPGDTDQLTDLYDARVGGGIPQPAATACTGTGCQGLPAAQPIFATPASGTFEGIGNLPPVAVSKSATSEQLAILSHFVRRRALTLTVVVPAAGKLSVTGKGLKPTSKSTSGRQTIELRLESQRGGRFTTTVKVVFSPRSGSRSTKTVLARFK